RHGWSRPVIVVDEAAARLVADAYDASASRRDRLVEASYAQLAVECDRLFREMTAPDRPGAVRVRFTTCRAPYAAAGELIDAVRTTRLLEVVTVAADPDRRHPLVDSTAGGAYDRFRAVH